MVAVSSLAGAAPIWLAVTLLYAAAGATAWSTRHTLGQHHPQAPGVVRIGTLAAWPTGHGAGLHHLGRHLCALADTQQVTLDLVARTPTLIDRYTRTGFTQPDPGRARLVRHPAGSPGAPLTPLGHEPAPTSDGGTLKPGPDLIEPYTPPPTVARPNARAPMQHAVPAPTRSVPECGAAD